MNLPLSAVIIRIEHERLVSVVVWVDASSLGKRFDAFHGLTSRNDLEREVEAAQVEQCNALFPLDFEKSIWHVLRVCRFL